MKRRLFFTNRDDGRMQSAEELTEEERKEIGFEAEPHHAEAMGATPMKEQKNEQESA